MPDDPHLLHRWMIAAYGHGDERPRPDAAQRMLQEHPQLADHDAVACAVGDVAAVQRAIARDPAWVNRTPSLTCVECGAPLDLPPLVAVTLSSLGSLPEFRDGLRSCARLLLDAGADPNQTWRDDARNVLSALYGAAGRNHDPEMTRLLLSAGANPNDGESLYHSVEAPDRTCTRLLLEAGARVEGSNAIHHQLDREDLEGLRLLLAHTPDLSELSRGLGPPLLWAIYRGRSRSHVDALLAAGADPRARNKDGVSAYRLATQNGLADVADTLRQAGADGPLAVEEQFVAACARGVRTEALRIVAATPDIVARLSGPQLHQLPLLASAGKNDGVRLMVELGWPIAVRGGDWQASALNHAVFRGDAALTRFLLEHGASWTERHGYNDNVNGTLGWASRNRPYHGDWVGCARALLDHGMPLEKADGVYSDDVAAFFAVERATAKGRDA